MKLGDTNETDLKAQLGEYHLVVSEVIGGISADLIETNKKLSHLQNKYNLLLNEVKTLKDSNRLLIKNILGSDNNDS